MPIWTLDDYAKPVAPRISMVPGVAQVQVGGQKYAVRCRWIRKLEADHIGLPDIDAALQSWNVNVPRDRCLATSACNIEGPVS